MFSVDTLPQRQHQQASQLCSDAEDDIELMEQSLKEVWDTLNEGAELASCSAINGLYRSAVWDELCEELPKGLLALLVSCILLSALLLLLVSCCGGGGVLLSVLLLLLSRSFKIKTRPRGGLSSAFYPPPVPPTASTTS